MALENALVLFEEALFDTDKEGAIGIIKKELEAGQKPDELIFKVVIPAMSNFMDRINKDVDANLAQHFMTSQIAAEATELLLSKFQTPPEPIGRVIIGTSFGDLHTLGKRIVSGVLKSMLIDVIDVGTNVPAIRFVDEAIAHKADVIAISSMMLHTARSEEGCKKVRQILKERGLEDKIKVIVGGAPYRFDSELYKTVGADSWAPDGVSAGRRIAELIEEARK